MALHTVDDSDEHLSKRNLLTFHLVVVAYHELMDFLAVFFQLFPSLLVELQEEAMDLQYLYPLKIWFLTEFFRLFITTWKHEIFFGFMAHKPLYYSRSHFVTFNLRKCKLFLSISCFKWKKKWHKTSIKSSS